MKLSVKQYVTIIAVIGVIILVFLFIHFEVDELAKASFEDDDREVWMIEPVEYPVDEEGRKHLLIVATFYNSRLFENPDGETVECTNFDFVVETTECNTDPMFIEAEIPFIESYEIVYNPVIEMVKYDWASEAVEIDVRCSDDDNNVLHEETKSISISRSQQVEKEPFPEPPEEPVPGFEAVFAIAGLMAVIYLIKRK